MRQALSEESRDKREGSIKRKEKTLKEKRKKKGRLEDNMKGGLISALTSTRNNHPSN